MRRPLTALLALVTASVFGCNAIYGIDELCADCGPAGGGGASLSTTAVGGAGGGSTLCEPADTRACYGGPADTQNIGACLGGLETCALDGMSWGPCEGEVLPTEENCASPEDEDCNGRACLETVWSKRFGGVGSAQGRAVRLSPSGDVLIAGSYAGADVDFGGGNLPPSSFGNNGFVATLSAVDGNHASSFALAPMFGTLAASALAVQDSGSMAVGMELNGNATLGAFPLSSQGGGDGVIALTGADGSVTWALKFGGDGNDSPEDVAFLNGGDIVVAGSINGAGVSFNGTNVSKNNNNDGLLARVAAQDGAVVWVNAYGSGNNQFVNQVEVTRTGNIVVGGYFRNQISFGTVQHSAVGDYDLVIAELQPDGSEVWSTAFGGLGADRLFDLALDADGDILVAGMFNGDLTFGSDQLVASDDDAFVAKLDDRGGVRWSMSLSTAETDTAYGIGSDDSGNVWVTGRCGPGIDLGGGTLGGNSMQPNLFVLKVDPAGSYVHGRVIGVLDDNGPPTGFWPGRRHIAVDDDGFAYVTGYFRTALDFAPELLTSAGADDVFIAKLAP